MDKKNIVNDLYQAAVISIFAVRYSMLGKKIALPSIRSSIWKTQEKLVGISHQTEDPTGTH